MIKVLVVEDSATVRQCLREALTARHGFDIVGEAVDGAQAVDLCRRLRPDVITMDVVLPVMSGLVATERIMSSQPTPILVVSSTSRQELFTTYDALAAGAVDVLEKPRGDASDDSWGARLRTAVKVVSRIRVVTRHRPAGAAATAVRGAARTHQIPRRLVAIGASTGGPGAIVTLLRGVPQSFTVPLLYVQHLAANENFAQAFTGWLAEQTGHTVRYARGGESLQSIAGQVVMAPPDRHLTVRGGHLYLSSGPPRHSCRPSVDALFESIAAEVGNGATGVLLTGMGRDGAEGLLAMRRAGAHTYAQDQGSCVVYGMPKEAVALNAAVEILPPDQIAASLTEKVGWRTRS
ncbi:chemotaxis-specific protein-glutamate methyltransferase CheB [Dactylosporangium sp. NPDC005555]|uniref:chemotaxis-specific protein-glutamate methyltransferase CheB n=1 Tax=Dactylosporangium sp. NPDC005555 TaxID=3154889 RepID=UPI0033AD43A3